jgi:hypothetical protein
MRGLTFENFLPGCPEHVCTWQSPCAYQHRPHYRRFVHVMKRYLDFRFGRLLRDDKHARRLFRERNHRGVRWH